MILKGVIYGAIIIILLIITLITFFAFIKNKKQNLIYFIISLIVSVLFIIYAVFITFGKIKSELNSAVETTTFLAENKENTEDTTTIKTIELADGINYILIEIDDLFSGFAHDNKIYEAYYLNREIVVEGRVDAIIKNCERKKNGSCLVLYTLTGTKYDVGYFLFDNDVLEDLEKLKTDETVQVKAMITAVQFSGMLGVDLVFEDCELLVELNVEK